MGMKVARACPAISHLLFADDSLFFCKTQKKECQTILKILKEYEAVSGHLINFQKTSIQFGHKIEVFSFMHDQLTNRINGWIFWFFTKGGNEVIIKSVVTALPNHVMSCYRLPKAIAKKLTIIVAQFWWSPGKSTRGLHWKSWDKVCINKDEGGLGFKDIMDFNTAMLGKQLWRLIEKSNTLFSRVFKGRYYKNAALVEPIKSYSPSYGWQIIVSARSLVSKGLIKRVHLYPTTRPRPANKIKCTYTQILQLTRL